MDFQIMLLPVERYWAWARAGSAYATKYGVNLTSNPTTAGNYMAPGQVITFPDLPEAFPEQGNLVEWFDANYPGIRVDPVQAGSPDEFSAHLEVRLDADDRYGQRQRPFYLLWPTKYPVITQKFGANPQIYRRFGMPGHEGLDIRALPYTDVTCAADGVVYEVHANPNDHPYGIHIRIRHAFGYRTIYGHLAKTMVGWGQQVAAGDVIGKADTTGATTASHLHLSLKQDGATARKETNYPKDIIDPTPFMVWPDSSKAIDSKSRPAGKCLRGAYTAECAGLTDEEIEVLADSRIEAVRVGAGEQDETIARLRARLPGAMILARLQADFADGPVEPGAFVRAVEGNTRRLAGGGVLDFEIHAHPNLQSGGWRRSWRDGEAFAMWFLRVVGRLSRLCPEARWGFPGLAPGEYLSGWREDEYRFLEQADEAVAASDWIGVNCAWTGAAAMRSIQGGLSFRRYQGLYPGKPLIVTEFRSLSDRSDLAARADQYAAYFKLVRNEAGVIAAFGPLSELADASPAEESETAFSCASASR